LPAFEARETVVLGVSPDDLESHRRFSEKLSLNFPLLSDEAKEVVQRYGVWQLKNVMGRQVMGVVRTTFVIDKNGIVRKVFPNVRVDGHAAEVLRWIDEHLRET